MATITDATRHRDQDELNTQKRAALLGIPYFDTRGRVATLRLVRDTLTVQEMREGFLVPLGDGNENLPLVFGITVQTPQSLLRELRTRFQGRVVQFYMISLMGYREFLLRYDPPKQVTYQDVTIAAEGDSNTIAEVSKTLNSVGSDDILDYLITQADRLNASDIHLECQANDIRVRFRIFGSLHPVADLSKDKYRVLIAAIASRANVSTAGTDPQTGHMQQEVKRPDGSMRLLNMRVETIPTLYGQDVVVRLFNFDEALLDLQKLGMNDQHRQAFEEVIRRPHGMVMIVGPTGSGKSTTLYALIKALNDTSRKILTLEDPVEFSIPGISQIPVNTNAGDSFAENLRAVMRLDPDVVMVGEIRDVDTAKTALQASITGHLVLSTFHAESSATAFSRMIDMIGKNPIFSTAIRMVVAQRLVRRLDDKTKIAYQPDEATKQYMAAILQDLPSSVSKPDLNTAMLYRPGTSAEAPFGYVGRVVIMEQMMVSPEIQAFLRGDVQSFDARTIEQVAKAQGMISLEQDGVLKALAGVTALEEIARVI